MTPTCGSRLKRGGHHDHTAGRYIGGVTLTCDRPAGHERTPDLEDHEDHTDSDARIAWRRQSITDRYVVRSLP